MVFNPDSEKEYLLIHLTVLGIVIFFNPLHPAKDNTSIYSNPSDKITSVSFLQFRNVFSSIQLTPFGMFM